METIERDVDVLDLDKPLETLSGKPISIISFDGPVKDFPIVGYIKGSEVIRTWSREGKLRGATGGSQMHIINSAPLPEYTLKVTDGHSEVLAVLKVIPEENRIEVLSLNGVSLYKDGKDIGNLKPTPSSRERGTVHPKEIVGKVVQHTQSPQGGLATAFFNQIKSGSVGDVLEGDMN